MTREVRVVTIYTSSDVILIACFIVAFFVLAALYFAGSNADRRVKQLEFEAVMRGYAEWYSEKEGQQPNKWRWKESVE